MLSNRQQICGALF